MEDPYGIRDAKKCEFADSEAEVVYVCVYSYSIFVSFVYFLVLSYLTLKCYLCGYQDLPFSNYSNLEPTDLFLYSKKSDISTIFFFLWYIYGRNVCGETKNTFSVEEESN